MLRPAAQPSVQSLLLRMSHELNAKAIVFFDGSGQILARSGWLEESNFPAMAALAAAMISAARGLGELGESEAPSRFSCDSNSTGLYTVGVGEDRWLTTLYDQPLNPGKFRMRIRRFAETLAQLDANPADWQPEKGVTLLPEPENTTPLENLTEQDSTLFANITDDEIDRLFENPSS